MTTQMEALVPVPDDYAGLAASVVRFDRLPHSGDDDRDLERYARAAWTRLVEPDNHWARTLVGQFGPVGALAALADRSESVVGQFHPRLAMLDVPRDLEIADRYRARILIPGDAEWPPGLDDLDLPPYALWVRGPHDLAALSARSVAVVGARACSDYGINVANDLGWGLAGHGFTVVSGAAFGIDAAAHRGALAAEGLTVAVLACGIDKPYPTAHADLIATIAARGVVVTETAPGCSALKSRFLQRNRLIATMTQGTVVVEAGIRSGSKNTAGYAAKYHRVVMAVPGRVNSSTSAGCHEIIRSGMAQLVTDHDEVAELLSPVGESMAPARRAPRRPRDELSSDDARVLDTLSSRARSVTSIATVVGTPLRGTTAALGRLEALGLAVQTDTGWRTPPRKRGN
ncbi:MAG: DNA-processing protein DprA [Dermatophilus congolensis]|nr:DNA-processing protein DprA [Dermatophilus congolensis]